MFLFIGVVIGGVFVAKLLFGPEPAVPPAPAGKVWSEEHGHYHDAPVGAQTNAGPNGAATATSPLPAGGANQPQGEAPPGKVWSAEHGHYHDAPAGATPGAVPGNPAANSAVPPAGATGQTAPPAAVQNIPQPAGPAPPGKVWSSEHGHWHDAPRP
jgi:hypothetical protein